MHITAQYFALVVDDPGGGGIVEQVVRGRQMQVAVEGYAQRLPAVVVAGREPGVVVECSGSTYHDGSFFGAPFVHQFQARFARDLKTAPVKGCNESVPCLRPFEDDVGTFQAVKTEEPAVHPKSVFITDTGCYLYPALFEYSDSLTAYFFKRVGVGDHHLLYLLQHQPVGAGRSNAIVGARLEVHIHGAFAHQVLVGLCYIFQAVHLGMVGAVVMVVALAYGAAIVHHYRPYHGVGCSVAFGFLSQFKTAPDMNFVVQCSKSSEFQHMRCSTGGYAVFEIIFTAMLSYGKAFYWLKEQLQQLYDTNEAAAISHSFMEFLTGLGKLERLTNKDVLLTEIQQKVFDTKSAVLLQGKPVQYVTGSAWFLGRAFFVNEHVLIPRPETEELVQWITGEVKSQKLKANSGQQLQILDIGTGSGCIPISLKLGLEEVEMTSCDISEEALAVAGTNAGKLNAAVNFVHLDFLDTTQHNKLAEYDVIVSNPPYIPAAEKEKLDKNVSEYEPGVALFVPDNDALVFYRAIAGFGRRHLKSNGYIYCELDAGHADECRQLFAEAGYKHVELRKDMHGNWRMLRCTQGGIGNL